jgi:2'-5' RNA ligase
LHPDMDKRRYALVAYVKNAAGEFVEKLRRELHPELPHFPAHLTILPPRRLQGTEQAALDVLDRICGEERPFEVHLGEVETFIPVTPTVYIRVNGQAARMSELHGHLNVDGLAFEEEWPYIPHLTIVKMLSPEAALKACQVARTRWAEYGHGRRIMLETLTFVREESENCWVDLAAISLGGRLVSR